MGRGAKRNSVAAKSSPMRREPRLPAGLHPVNLGKDLGGAEISLSSEIITKAIEGGLEVNIVVDIDNTLFPIDHALREIGVDLQLTEVQRYEEASEAVLRAEGREDLIHAQDPKERAERAEIISGAFSKIHSNANLMHGVGAYEGAREVLQQLSDMGIKIHVITHRDPSHREATEEWLDLMDIPRDSVKVDWENKIEWCKNNGVSVIVDDHPNVIREAHAVGIGATSLSWPYARNHLEETKSFSARNWLELGEHIIDLLERDIQG